MVRVPEVEDDPEKVVASADLVPNALASRGARTPASICPKSGSQMSVTVSTESMRECTRGRDLLKRALWYVSRSRSVPAQALTADIRDLLHDEQRTFEDGSALFQETD